LVENAHSLISAILRAKPPAAKGNYMRSIAVSTTMGPGVKIDPMEARTTAVAA
jgi:large subunit ribosomal protein L1